MKMCLILLVNNNNFYYCSYCFLFLLFLIFIINFFLFLYIYFSFSLSHLNISVYFSQLLCSALCALAWALVFLFAWTVFTSRCFGWLYSFTQTQQHHRVSTEPADHGPSRNVSVTRTPECLAPFAAALFWNGVECATVLCGLIWTVISHAGTSNYWCILKGIFSPFISGLRGCAVTALKGRLWWWSVEGHDETLWPQSFILFCFSTVLEKI